MKKNTVGLFLVGLSLLSLTGCAGRLVKLDPSYLSSSKKVAIIWTQAKLNHGYVREGQFLGDALISELTKAPWITNIETFDLSPVVNGEFNRLWKPYLDKKSISYTFVRDAVSLDFYKAKQSVENGFVADAKSIPEIGNPDYLVVFQVLKFDVHHSHALLGFMATAAPAVKFNYRLLVVRVSDNQIIGDAFGDKSVSMKEGWEKGPEYLGIYEAMITAVSEGISDVYTKVIGD